MSYRRLASPLHAARASAALAWCAALALAALVQSNPLLLGATCVAVLAAGTLAGIGRPLRSALRFAVVLGLTICVINALVTRDGVTVVWRFGNLPLLGDTNVTLEATVYGAVLGLRAAVLVLLGVTYSVAVDPDEVLRLFRRVSFRSALTATIATRMVPVLLRDSRRLADAQRTRPGAPPGRSQLLRATTAGVFDRALDVAAALEVRGYGVAQRPAGGRLGGERPVGRPAARGAGSSRWSRSWPQGGRRPWSRHDLAFAASATLVTVVSLGGRVVGWDRFDAYPELHAPAGALQWALTAALLAAALFPFLDRRGVST